jgi:peptidoglycan/LPS O-acetylase OafA/YrhL
LRSHRLPQLDGIRGIAILGVMLCHYTYDLPESPPHSALSRTAHALSFGWMGVDLFFVLSGFLIASILIANRGAANYFGAFYARRACRIIPLYAIVLALGILTDFSINMGASFPEKAQPISLLWYATFTQNMAPARLNGPIWFGPSWSLAVEEQFYLIAPIAIWFLSRRNLLVGLVVLAIAAPLLRLALHIVLSQSSFAAFAFILPARMDSLIAGVICAWLLSDETVELRVRDNLSRIKSVFLATSGLVAIFIAINWQQQSLSMDTIGLSVIACCGGSLLLICILDADGFLTKGMRIPALGWLGRRAYFLYVFHNVVPYSIFQLFGRSTIASAADVALFGLAMLVLFAAAELSWRCIEKPLIDFGHRIQYQRLRAETLGVDRVHRRARG